MDPQVLRDHGALLTPGEPLGSLKPQPLAELPPLVGESTTLRVPHTSRRTAGIKTCQHLRQHKFSLSKGGLKDLDPFVTAFGKLEAANAKATAIVMSPKAWTALMALRESSGSLKPLLSESAGSPTAGIQRSILGVPVWLSSFVPESDILTYEADQVFAVWRKDAGFQISDQFGFFKDGTAVRAIARAAIAVPNAAAVCKITVTA
ncbi:phage major capsid protein [Streptomyces sp. NPDC002537]